MLDDDTPLLPSPGADVSDSTATEENDSAVDFTASTPTIELSPSGASVRLESVPVRSAAPPATSTSAGELLAESGGNSRNTNTHERMKQLEHSPSMA